VTIIVLYIKNKCKRCWKIVSKIRKRIHPPFPVDLLVHTSELLQQRLKQGDGFLEDINFASGGQGALFEKTAPLDPLQKLLIKISVICLLSSCTFVYLCG